jgi:hypothetical protein
MKSSYVLIIVVFVILVSATVIAKLASQIQLSPKRAPVTQWDNDDPEIPETDSRPEPPQQIGIDKALADGLVTVTADTRSMLSIDPGPKNDTLNQTLVVPMGTSFGSDHGNALFVAYPTQEFSLGDETMSVSVLPCRIETAILKGEALSFASGDLNWVALVRTKSFRMASPNVRQYAVWALGKDIRLHDLQPLLKSETEDPRLRLTSISDDERASLTTVLTVSELVDPSQIPLLADMSDYQLESDAVVTINAAYQAFDDADAQLLRTAINKAQQAVSELKSGSIISVEVSGIALLQKLRAINKPNLQSLPSVVVQQIDEVIEQLESDKYPADDLESRLQSALQGSLKLCLSQALLGQVRVLADRVTTETAGTDLITRLHAAETEFLGICERQFRVLEDKQVLPNSVVNHARMMFVPDDEALRRLNRLSAVPLDDIPKSKRRDIVRQLSVMYLELAQAAVRLELPELGVLFANRAIAQEIKAPGVNSKAQRILRTIDSAAN